MQQYFVSQMVPPPKKKKLNKIKNKIKKQTFLIGNADK